LPRQSSEDAVHLPAAKSATDVLAAINAPQNETFVHVGSFESLTYRKRRSRPEAQPASKHILTQFTLAQQDAVVLSASSVRLLYIQPAR
jgi:hypothetical protein